MREIIASIAIAITTVSCFDNHPDFSNPKSVVEYYYSKNNNGGLESEYTLIADKCKSYLTLDEYLRFYKSRDSILNEYDYYVEEINQMPIDPSYSEYRYYEIQHMVFNKTGGDTIRDIVYKTVVNQGNQWRVIWVSNISESITNLIESQRYSEAIDMSSELLKIDPFNGGAYRQIAWSHFLLGDENRALDNIRKAIRFYPKDEDNYNVIASIYSDIGKNELAIENYKKAIDIAQSKDEKTSIYSNLSIVYSRLGKVKEAKDCLNRLLLLDSTRTHSWWIKGLIFEGESNLDSAIICYNKAMSFEPMSDHLQHQLFYSFANATYKKSQHSDENDDYLLIESKKYLLKALDLSPENIDYQLFLELLNQRDGREYTN